MKSSLRETQSANPSTDGLRQSAEGILVGDLNLTALRKARNDWNPVYGLPYRVPAAYKRLKAGQ